MSIRLCPPKHYTLTRDVKAGDYKHLDFSIGGVGG